MRAKSHELNVFVSAVQADRRRMSCKRFLVHKFWQLCSWTVEIIQIIQTNQATYVAIAITHNSAINNYSSSTPVLKHFTLKISTHDAECCDKFPNWQATPLLLRHPPILTESITNSTRIHCWSTEVKSDVTWDQHYNKYVEAQIKPTIKSSGWCADFTTTWDIQDWFVRLRWGSTKCARCSNTWFTLSCIYMLNSIWRIVYLAVRVAQNI